MDHNYNPDFHGWRHPERDKAAVLFSISKLSPSNPIRVTGNALGVSTKPFRLGLVSVNGPDTLESTSRSLNSFNL